MLRIRIPEAALQQLKSRAEQHGEAPAAYAEMVLHYVLHERSLVQDGLAESQAGNEADVYFAIEISSAAKQRLGDWSARQQLNIAAFGGELIRLFLERVDRDPRELAMVHYLIARLDEAGKISEEELCHAIQLWERRSLDARTAGGGHVARWLFSRLRPLLRHVERDGQPVELTLRLIEDLLPNER